MHSAETSDGSLLRDRNLHIIFGISLLAVMGVSSIAPALPSIMRDLGISKLDVAWLITAFTIPGMVLAPFIGVMADRLGRKRILVPSIFLFAIAGTSCAFTRDFQVLIILRVFQGIGTAALGAINLTLIGDLYSRRRRAEAMGLNASALSIGAASYPLIGGGLALLGWHYPFYLSLLAVPMGFIVLTALRNPEPSSGESFRSYLGGIWGFLRNIKTVAIFASGVLTFIIVFGVYLTYLTIYMDESFGASGLYIGILISIGSLTTAIVSSQMGRITRWVSEGTLIKASFALYGLSLVLIPPMNNLWLLIVPVIIFGIAQGMNLPSILTLVAGMATIEYRGAFMSINAAMLRVGMTVGPLVVGLCYVYLGAADAFHIIAGMAFVASAIGLLTGKAVRTMFVGRKGIP